MSRERIAYNPDSYIGGITEEVDQSYILNDGTLVQGPSFIGDIDTDISQSYINESIKKWSACNLNCANLGVFNDRTAVTENINLCGINTSTNDWPDWSQTDGDGTLVWTIAHDNTRVTMAGAGSKSKYLYVPFETAANVEYKFTFTGASSGVGITVKFGFLDENLQITGSTSVSHTSGSKTISVTPSQNGTYAFVQITISLPSSPTFTFSVAPQFFIADHDYVGLRHTEYPGLSIGDRIYIGDTSYIGTYFVSARYFYQLTNSVGFLISTVRFGVPVVFNGDEVRVNYKTY